MLTQTLQSTRDCALGPFSRTVNCDIKIGLGILNHNILQASKRNLDATAFVVATARSIDVEQAHSDRAHIMTGPVKGEL